MTFSELNLAAPILNSILQSGYNIPTPIQAEAIPAALNGEDLIASAQTGTGKTAAFMLPALQRLLAAPLKPGRGPRVLVLTPTRELAQQVNEAARKYGRGMRVNTVSILGGMPYPLQNRLLSQPVDILVATPGRLIDHINRGRIDFSRLELLVLDEADRMLDMGFIEDVERIVLATPATRQTLLFSATMDGPIAKLAQRILMNPGARNRTLQSLRRGQLRVLVATDVAARGIDVLGISHVVNFDLPKVAEDYVHRIGRTGRAGAKGIALTLVSGRDTLLLKRI